MTSNDVPTLKGNLVTLRAIDLERDAGDYYRWNQDEEIHRWTGNRVHDSIDEARQELERLAHLSGFTMWSIVDNTSGEMVGRFFVCLEQQGNLLVAGEGNRIARTCWRKGHNREARQLVFRYVFDTCNADVIESACWQENTNSRLSLLAHGFRHSFTTAEINDKYHRILYKDHFLITRNEWLHKDSK